jgi:hypothetical protein
LLSGRSFLGWADKKLKKLKTTVQKNRNLGPGNRNVALVATRGFNISIFNYKIDSIEDLYEGCKHGNGNSKDKDGKDKDGKDSNSNGNGNTKDCVFDPFYCTFKTSSQFI